MLPRMPPTPVTVKQEKPAGVKVKQEKPAAAIVKEEKSRWVPGTVIPPPVTIKTERPVPPAANPVPAPAPATTPVLVPAFVPAVRQEPTRVRPALPSSPPPVPKVIPPWAVKPELVVVKRGDSGGDPPVQTVRIVPVAPSNAAPWSRPEAVIRPAEPERSDHAGVVPSVAPDENPSDPTVSPAEEVWVRKNRVPYRSDRLTAMDGPLPLSDLSNKLLRAANYMAVDPSRKVYGLIDRGLTDSGTRTLIMHVRNRHHPFPVFEKVRPGEYLPAVSKSNRGGTTLLRVRYITPDRYYHPGSKVSTMRVGVDEADWQSLVAKAHRI